MATISGERLREIANNSAMLLEEKVSLVQEILTARSYIPRLQEGIQGNIETISKLNGENHNLEQTARVYAEQQQAMIGEIRELKRFRNEAIDTISDLSGQLELEHKISDKLGIQGLGLIAENHKLTEALRWIWAFMYTGEGVHDGKLYPVYGFEEEALDQIRQILATIGLPAPEQK